MSQQIQIGNRQRSLPQRKWVENQGKHIGMRQPIQSFLAVSCLVGMGLHSTPGLTQMRGPRISSVRDVSCVANWERRFQILSPGLWEMTMGTNDRNPFIFHETDRSSGSIWLQSVHDSRLKAILNLQRQSIKYIIPGQEYDPLYFNIQSYNINGGEC